jgi:hypothetical protein
VLRTLAVNFIKVQGNHSSQAKQALNLAPRPGRFRLRRKWQAKFAHGTICSAARVTTQYAELVHNEGAAQRLVKSFKLEQRAGAINIQVHCCYRRRWGRELQG